MRRERITRIFQIGKGTEKKGYLRKRIKILRERKKEKEE